MTSFSQHSVAALTAEDSEFRTVSGAGGSEVMENPQLGYTLPIRPGGRAPKTGIILCKVLDLLPVAGKRVLDIGTGETALIANHAAALAAAVIVGLEPEPSAAMWARKVVAHNCFSRVTILETAVGEYSPDQVFDLIVSNPPQMPAPVQRSVHDDSAVDGKDCFREIIKLATGNVQPGGLLVVNAFEFLGVEDSYNSDPSLFEILRQGSFEPTVVRRSVKEAAPGGWTARSIGYIREIYPKYVFATNDNGNYQFDIVSIVAEKQ